MRNDLLLARGLVESFDGFGNETAGRLGAMNTADALLPVEVASVNQGRICNVGPYGDYREYAQLKRPESFRDINPDPKISKLLEDLYGQPDRVEFYPGLFCEDPVPNSPLPPLILKLVAVDAFSQALTNPLVSEHVFNERTFSEVGWNAIQTTASLANLLQRNSPRGLQGAKISMTRADWKYVW
jgi:prostaglandin-endoperoxide synthase 2